MFRIWIDEPLLDSVLPIFDGVAELVGPGASPEELATCDAALVPGTRWDAARMDAAPRLRVLSRIGVGYDNIDVAAATARGIAVCYTPQAPTVSTAEHALALLFALAKRVCASERDVRAGRWHPTFWTHKGMELDGRTLGLVGAGRIGGRVAVVARAIGMRVIAFDPFLDDARAAELGVECVGSLDALLAESDVVSLHAPSTSQTRHMIDAARLAQMKPGALLINTARGALIDEAALVDALRSGRLGGAGLDVFEREPIDPAHPLLTLDNVVLTDHIASHTWAGHHRLYETAVLQALQALRGERPAGLLNAMSDV
jgi:D-3-phosphoglycerate dehydrogenase